MTYDLYNMTYNLYIGANNETKMLELDKIIETTTKRFKGFTVIPAIGFWEGKEENSAVLVIETEDGKGINELVEELKEVLGQESIGAQVANPIEFK